LVSGAPYTGGTTATNLPQLYVNDGTGPTTFSANGTEIGANAPSGFTGNFLDFHLNGGASLASLNYVGNATFNALTSSTSLTTGSGAATVCGSINGCIGLTNGSSAMVATSGQCGLRGDSVTGRILYNCDSTSDTLLIGTGDNAQLATLGLGAAPTTTSPLHIATAIAGSPAAGDLGLTSTSAGEYTQLQSYDGTYTHTYTAETHRIGPSLQSGAISQTTIVSPGVATAYRVCYVLDSATSSGSGTIQLTVTATDNGLITRTSTAVSLTANTNGDSACWVFKLAASAALKYSTAYGGSGSGNYTLGMFVEPI
jgi:hypothetical protein